MRVSSWLRCGTWHFQVTLQNSNVDVGSADHQTPTKYLSYVCLKVLSNLIKNKNKSILQPDTVLCNVSCLSEILTQMKNTAKHHQSTSEKSKVSLESAGLACFIKLQPSQFAVAKCLYHNSSSELQLLIWSSWQGNFVPKLLGLDTAQLTEGPYFSLLEV